MFKILDGNAADSEAVNVESTDTSEILMLAEETRDQLALDLGLEFAERIDADANHTPRKD